MELDFFIGLKGLFEAVDFDSELPIGFDHLCWVTPLDLGGRWDVEEDFLNGVFCIVFVGEGAFAVESLSFGKEIEVNDY